VNIESRLSSDSTINGVNTVIARTGAAGKSEYVDPGLPLFVAAAQVKANRTAGPHLRMLSRQQGLTRSSVEPHLDAQNLLHRFGRFGAVQRRLAGR
jgi:hypothetical protein